MKGNLASFLFVNFKKKPMLYILLFLIAVCVALSALLPSYGLKFLVDYLSNDSISHDNVIWYAMGFFGTYVLNGLLTFFEGWLLVRVGETMVKEVRKELMDKVNRLPFSYFSSNDAGYITSRITDDVDSLQTLFTDGVVSMGVDLIQIIATIVSIYVFSWIMGLVLTAIVPLAAWFMIHCQKKIEESQSRNRVAINGESSYLSECITNARTIKNLGKKSYAKERYGNLIIDSYNALKQSYLYESLYSPVIQLIRAVIIAVIVLLTVKDPSVMLISAGSLAAAINLVTDIFSPIESLGNEVSSLEEGIAAYKRIDLFLKERDDIERDDSITSDKVLGNDKRIVVSNLSFVYPDGVESVFDGGNLIINEGEKVALVGRTGAGKSTLFKLIMGLYEPSVGSVSIGGYEASLIPDSQKREIYGYVQQGFHPVKGTIRDQITLFDSSISQERVEEVMKSVNLDNYVKTEIKGGYDAVFQESQFSKGQLQLLSTARALVKNPPFILLDEISANLDSETEKMIMELFRKNFDGKTVISISHRLLDLGFFERTIKVEDRKIEELKN